MRTTLYTSTNPDGTGNVRDPTETMYPPNISLGFGVPRKTKSRRLNNLMYFQKISCISARSRVHFVDNSLNEGPMNESIIAHVAPSFRKPRLVPDESWPICARHAGRDIMRTGGFQSKRSLGFCLGFWGIIRYELLVLVVKGGCLARIYHRLCCVVVDGARRSPLRPCDRGPRA